MTPSASPLISPVLLALTLTIAGAAAPSQNREFVQAQQANSAALHEYTWKSRTELSLNGEIRNVTLQQVRYDLDGKLQKTRIGGTEPQQGSGRGRRGGFIQQRVIAKKQADFKELLADLTALVTSYSHLPQEKLQGFAARATISKGQGAAGGTVRIQGGDVLVAGDSMIVWVDPTSHMMRRVEIRTTLELKPVHVVADYRSLDNGLTYQARAILQYPERDIEVAVENFEYQYVGTPR